MPPSPAVPAELKLPIESRAPVPPTSDQPGGAYDGIFVEDFEYVPGSGDLDECGGRTGVTPEFPGGIVPLRAHG